MPRLFCVLLAASLSLLGPRSAAGELIEITSLNRSNVLKIKGSLALACYAPGHGQAGLYGRTVWQIDANDNFREFFDNKGLPWIKAQVKSFERAAARTRKRLSRAARDERAGLVQQYKSELKSLQSKARQGNAVSGRACAVFFASAGDPATPPPAPTATPTPTDQQGDEREALENPFQGNELDPLGLARLEPGVPTVRVFVDAALGDDSGNGLTEEAPLRSIEAAVAYLSTISSEGKSGGWILLKRGTAFTTFPALSLSGWSQEYPLMIGAYGEAAEPRPIISAPIHLTTPLSNLVFSDIHLSAPSPGVGTGLRITAGCKRLLIQNSLFTGFRHGVWVEGLSDQPIGRASDISIHRNVFKDIASANGPSYGVRIINADGVILTSNVFAAVGRNQSRGIAPTAESIAAFVGTGISNYTAIRGNQFLGGGTGLEVAGTQNVEVRANLFARVGIAANIEAFGALITENAVIEGTDLGAANRGWGIKVSNARALQMNSNVIANTLSSPSPADYAIKVEGQADMGFHLVEYNDIYDWGYGLHIGNIYWNDYQPFQLSYKDMTIQNQHGAHAASALVTLEGRAPLLGAPQFRRLKVYNPSSPGNTVFRIIEHNAIAQIRHRYRGWLWNRRCYATDIYVSPNMRQQVGGWYDGFALMQGQAPSVVSNPIPHFFTPNRFRFDECMYGYTTGAARVVDRVALSKFRQYAVESGSTIGRTDYTAPERTLAGFLAINSIPGSSYDDFVAYLTSQDRANFDFRTVGQRVAYWIRVGFNRP